MLEKHKLKKQKAQPSGPMAPDKLDEFLGYLAKKEGWQSLTKVAETIKIPEEKAEIIAQFLQKYAFITYNPRKRRVRIDPRVREIYQKDAKENLQENP